MNTTGRVLDKIYKSDALEFVKLCTRVLSLTDKESDLMLDVITLQGKNINSNYANDYVDHLESRWYESLQRQIPDYTVYNGVDMLPNMWSCWKFYSRQYLKNISTGYKLQVPDGQSAKNIIDDFNSSVKVVLDVGCGIGYTTAALTEMFPEAKVYATNLEGTAQYEVCKAVSELYNFTLVNNLTEIKHKIDLVFASEYFEHFEDAVSHLDDILKLKPDYLIIANAFSAKSVGHFDFYKYKGDKVLNKNYGRLFNMHMRDNGFQMIKTNCYNNRPTCWKRKGV